MYGTVLLTGATGFVGMEVLARLLERDEETQVIALIRAEGRADAQERLEGVLGMLFDDWSPYASRVTGVPGDVTMDNLGLNGFDRRFILERATSIIHCAASISFNLPLAQALNVNTDGAARIADLAQSLLERDRLQRVVHVSTAYVAGNHPSRFTEDDLAVGQIFRNSYEHSKFHAELLLRERTDLPLAIVRPSIIIGDSRSGWTPAFNVIYWALRGFAAGLIDELPADPFGRLDVVPVDYVASGILAAHDCEDDVGTFALVAGENAVTNTELATLASIAFKRPPLKLTRTGAAPPGGEVYLPYFDVRGTFDDRRTRALLGDGNPGAPMLSQYFAAVAGYAQHSRWGEAPLTRAAARVHASTPSETA